MVVRRNLKEKPLVGTFEIGVLPEVRVIEDGVLIAAFVIAICKIDPAPFIKFLVDLCVNSVLLVCGVFHKPVALIVRQRDQIAKAVHGAAQRPTTL